ncbi:hypothetical protein Clacol_001195 [Clathrus columnatus]|uniref:Peptidase A1 domain-containing protein n=1 Tax=Clathrus columnatus TaxID=1419009 RepID=A0AAV5A0C3_9AGAM|nr:hypothetical protein Clacol_001195 [Clathrus columnatus]
MKSSFFFLTQFIGLISGLPTFRQGSPGKSSATARLQRDDSLPQGFSLPINYDPIFGQYTTTIGIGNPPQNVTIIPDTGSSFTIIGVRPQLLLSSNTTTFTGNTFAIDFAAGEVGGVESKYPYFYIRAFGLASIASNTVLTTDFGGVLGLGPTEHTKGTLHSQPDTTIPTVMDTAFEEGAISSELLGIFLAFPTSTDPRDLISLGQINFGGVDPNLFCGNLNFHERSRNEDANADLFWALDASALQSSSSMILKELLDTGSPQILLSDSAFQKYQQLTGGVLGDDGFLRFSPTQVANIPPLSFIVNDSVISISGQAQILPAQLHTTFNFAPSEIVGFVQNANTNLGVNTTLFGYPFLTQNYIAIDVTNNQIALAQSVNSFDKCSSS